MSKGWECPKCGRVYSPKVKECKECNESPTLCPSPFYSWPMLPDGGWYVVPTPYRGTGDPAAPYTTSTYIWGNDTKTSGTT